MADGLDKREGGEFLLEAVTRRTARLHEHGGRQSRLNQEFATEGIDYQKQEQDEKEAHRQNN